MHVNLDLYEALLWILKKLINLFCYFVLFFKKECLNVDCPVVEVAIVEVPNCRRPKNDDQRKLLNNWIYDI